MLRLLAILFPPPVPEPPREQQAATVRVVEPAPHEPVTGRVEPVRSMVIGRW